MLSCCTSAGESDDDPTDGQTVLFGQRLIRCENPEWGYQGHWDDMVARQNRLAPVCRSSWTLHLDKFDGVRAASLLEKAEAVNDAVNGMISYDYQELNSGDETWYSPVETMLRGKGVCRDYATLKYGTLLALGVGSDRMYVACVTTPRGYHAVLAVNVSDSGQHYMVLDNAIQDGVYNARDSDYKIYNAINETGSFQPEAVDVTIGVTVACETVAGLQIVTVTSDEPEELQDARRQEDLRNVHGKSLVDALVSRAKNPTVSQHITN
jgi:predicted transglutaminase-like cysteine proteinase